jgi:hypothetical protein
VAIDIAREWACRGAAFSRSEANMKILAVVCTATISIAAAASSARADDKPEALTIVVDVEEHRGREVTARASYVLPIAGERTWSKLQEDKDGVHYAIEVGREGVDTGAPVIGISLVRKAIDAKQIVDQSMRAAVRLGRGGRMLAGHFERDATSTDVYVSRR